MSKPRATAGEIRAYAATLRAHARTVAARAAVVATWRLAAVYLFAGGFAGPCIWYSSGQGVRAVGARRSAYLALLEALAEQASLAGSDGIAIVDEHDRIAAGEAAVMFDEDDVVTDEIALIAEIERGIEGMLAEPIDPPERFDLFLDQYRNAQDERRAKLRARRE